MPGGASTLELFQKAERAKESGRKDALRRPEARRRRGHAFGFWPGLSWLGPRAASFLCLATAAAAWGAAHSASTGDYTIDRWQVDEGLPQTSVTSIGQTPDGYLWLGTFNGLARFDGVRFTVCDEGNTRALGSSRITQVLADAQGRLWIVTEPGGLARMERGAFFGYGPEQGLPPIEIANLAHGPDLALQLFDRSGRTYRVDEKRMLPAQSEGAAATPGPPALLFIKNSLCWVGQHGWARSAALDPAARCVSNRSQAPPERWIQCATPRSAGGLWLATTTGVWRFQDGQLQGEPIAFPDMPEAIRAMAEDARGNLWLATLRAGLVRWDLTHHWRPVKLGGALVENSVTCLLVDREDTLWVGSGNGGLYRVKRQSFQMHDEREGLPDGPVTSLSADAQDRVWIGINGGGLHCWEAGRSKPVNEPPEMGRSPLVYSVLADRHGAVWIGLYGKTALRLHAGVVEPYLLADAYSGSTPRTLFEDRAGRVWLGSDHGLWRFQDGWLTPCPNQDTFAQTPVRGLAEDRKDTLYVGLSGGGLGVLHSNRFTAYTERDGLADNHIMALWMDREESLWIGTMNGGLSRFRDGRFANLSVADGLPSNTIGTLIEDDSGDLWIGSNRGIARLKREELRDYLEGRRHDLPCRVFTRSDGLNTVACTGAGQPACCRTRDGRLWFSTAKGVAVVDPKTLPFNPLPPPVLIEQVSLDDQVQPLQSPMPRPGSSGALASLPASVARSPSLVVPANVHRVEFRFTGLSLMAAEKVRFRYRLEGLDRDWIEAGFQRLAPYIRIPAGRYRFRVSACNNDGVWNETGAVLGVTVLPAWWQTWWARLAAAAGLGGLAWLFYDRRVRWHKRIHSLQQAFSQKVIESQEEERKRIASGLHDSVGQDLLVIKNRAQLGLRDETTPPGVAQQLGEISRMASRAIDEVREVSRDLRPYQIDRLGLTKAVKAMVASVSQASGIPIAAEVDSIDGCLPAPVEIHFYRIIQELLNNVVKHSQAAFARVTVVHREQQIVLAVEDDGCGFESQSAGEPPERQGMGLAGIAERVRILGGAARCDSRPAAGTRWTIEIPTAKPRNS